MHLRRAVLLMALILAVVAIVGALVPVPRERTPDGPPPPVPRAGEATPVKTLSLRYPPPRNAPRVRVDAGAHVVLQVAASEPGQATVEALGLVGSAQPDTPARFDLLASRAGSYEVAFAPAGGGAARPVGTLTVKGVE